MPKIVKKKTIDDELKRIAESHLYFCPYCRVLFIEGKSSFVVVDVEKCKDKSYQCSECKECFSLEAYTEQARCGKNYYYPDDIYRDKKELVQDIIKDNITKLRNEGYSNRNIHKLTHFSRSKIETITKSMNVPKKSINKRDFCINYLKIPSENYELIMGRKTLKHQVPLSDELIDAILKGLKFGCSFRQVSSLFGVSNNTINKAKKAPYSITKRRLEAFGDDEADKRRKDQILERMESAYDKQFVFKNKISIENDKVTII